MTTSTNSSHLAMIIIVAALLSAASGFAPPSSTTIGSSVPRSSQDLRSKDAHPEIGGTLSNDSSSYHSAAGRVTLTIQRMASDDEDSEKTTESDLPTADNDDISTTAPAEAAAGGGTIALTSAKSAADAAEASSINASSSTNGADSSINTSSSPSNTGFSLLLLPTLLFKFTIVLIVKFATDVVVYPILYVWRWARVGRKKIGRGLVRLLGRDDEEKVNGVNGAPANGDSFGDFQ